jgi:hypothetical protein
MFENWRRLLSFFPRRERFRILALLAGTTFSGLLQALGIVSIMPFIAVLAQPDLVAENEYRDSPTRRSASAALRSFSCSSVSGR